MAGFVNGTACRRGAPLPEPEALLTPQLLMPTGTSAPPPCSAPSTEPQTLRVGRSGWSLSFQQLKFRHPNLRSEDEDEEGLPTRPCTLITSEEEQILFLLHPGSSLQMEQQGAAVSADALSQAFHLDRHQSDHPENTEPVDRHVPHQNTDV